MMQVCKPVTVTTTNTVGTTASFSKTTILRNKQTNCVTFHTGTRDKGSNNAIQAPKTVHVSHLIPLRTQRLRYKVNTRPVTAKR